MRQAQFEALLKVILAREQGMISSRNLRKMENKILDGVYRTLSIFTNGSCED